MNYIYHKNLEPLSKLNFQKSDVVYVKILSGNDSIHPRNNGPVLSIFSVNWKDVHVVNHLHDEYFKISFNEFINEFHRATKNCTHKFCKDLKNTLHFSDSFLGKYYNDFEVFFFNRNSEEPSYEENSLYKHFYKDKYSNGLNVIIPVAKHVEFFVEEINSVKDFNLYGELYESGYRSLTDKIIPFLYNIEKHGIYCDKKLVGRYFGEDKIKFLKESYLYSNYNIFSQTGRPSNAIYNINLSALNKDNGERSFIKSRYGKDGMLILFDFKAYHPHLLSNLINYKLPKFDDFYIWITDQMKKYADSTQTNLKGEVFTQMYGKIDKKYLKIEYFNKLDDFIKQRWKYFNDNGYVDTPIFKRSIKECHIAEPFPNKVTNYLLQAYETERNSVIMETVNHYLTTNKKLTLPVKYDYDGFLFDSNKGDGKETLIEIKNLLETGGYPVTVKVGNDFDKMTKIQL